MVMVAGSNQNEAVGLMDKLKNHIAGIICFAAGFNNISNFNRRFLDQKGMAPSRFRTLLAQNVKSVEAA